tara:strand:+ start:7238 stop:7390 length:153 start_codon:yes stop_codon:yes gene_type:complete
MSFANYEMEDVNFTTINKWIKNVDNGMKHWTVYTNATGIEPMDWSTASKK